jgi:hypothetical protein
MDDLPRNSPTSKLSATLVGMEANTQLHGALARAEVRPTKRGDRGMLVIELDARNSLVLWGEAHVAEQAAQLLPTGNSGDAPPQVIVSSRLYQRKDYSLGIELLGVRLVGGK